MTDASPLKVGMLHYSCPPVVGGVEQILEQHTMVLKRQGCSVSVLTGKGENYDPDVTVRVEPDIGTQSREVREANRCSMEGDHGPHHASGRTDPGDTGGLECEPGRHPGSQCTADAL